MPWKCLLHGRTNERVRRPKQVPRDVDFLCPPFAPASWIHPSLVFSAAFLGLNRRPGHDEHSDVYLYPI
jgi:hypothetical protein